MEPGKAEKVYQPKQQQEKPVVMVYQAKQSRDEGQAMFGSLPGLKVLDPTVMEKFHEIAKK